MDRSAYAGMNAMGTSRFTRTLLTVCAVLLVGVAISRRVMLMTGKPLWLDEIFTGAVSQSRIGALLPTWLAADVHPPLHYLLIDVWTRLFGASNIALRMPSLLFSLAVIAVGAWAMGRRHGRDAALLAAIALAVPAAAVWQASEARSYAMQMFLALLLMLAHWRVREKWDGKGWLALIGLSILLCLTHYFGFLFAACIWAVLLYDGWRARRVGHVVLGGVATALLLAPWLAWHLPYMLSKTGGNFWIAPLGFGESLIALIFSMWSDPVYWLLFALLPFSLRVRSQRRLALPAFPFTGYLVSMLVVAVVLALVSQRSPLVVPRYMAVFVPMAALIAVNLYHAMRPGWRLPVMTAAATAVLAMQFWSPPYGSAGWLAWEDASDWVEARHPDAMLFVLDDPAGRHIGTANLAKVGGFFLTRSHRTIPVVARTATESHPHIDDRLPAGSRVGVILVAGRMAGWPKDPALLARLQARYPRYECRPAGRFDPVACLFETSQP